MKIGILGVGNIGATLTRRLSASGHQVKVANSRGPETIPAEVFSGGGIAATASDVVTDIDALIISVPLNVIPGIRPLIDRLPADAVLLDTSNYYPLRDGHIPALDDGQVESLWVAAQLGRPVVKAWNAILATSFATENTPAGSRDRIAIPVAADDTLAREFGARLVDETGFDAVDAGPLSESWRQQPGTPAYCTDLTLDQLTVALAAADPARSPRRRDLVMTVLAELTDGFTVERSADLVVRLNRLLTS